MKSADAQESRGGHVEGVHRLNHREFNYDRKRRFSGGSKSCAF